MRAESWTEQILNMKAEVNAPLARMLVQFAAICFRKLE